MIHLCIQFVKLHKCFSWFHNPTIVSVITERKFEANNMIFCFQFSWFFTLSPDPTITPPFILRTW